MFFYDTLYLSPEKRQEAVSCHLCIVGIWSFCEGAKTGSWQACKFTGHRPALTTPAAFAPDDRRPKRHKPNCSPFHHLNRMMGPSSNGVRSSMKRFSMSLVALLHAVFGLYVLVAWPPLHLLFDKVPDPPHKSICVPGMFHPPCSSSVPVATFPNNEHF